MSCYQTITLQPGESFVLPPGAELIAATNSGDLTAENNCTTFDNLDEIVCLEIKWAIQPSGATPPVSPWSVGGDVPPDTHCIGIGIDNTNYSFVLSTSGDDYSLIKTSINDLASLNGISGIVNCYSSSQDGTPTGDRNTYSIKIRTTSSIAPLLYLRFQVVDFDAVRIYGEIVTCPTT